MRYTGGFRPWRGARLLFIVAAACLGPAPAALAEGGWVQQPTPASSAQPDRLWSVSCPAEDSCMAVGQGLASSPSAIAEKWDGLAWSLVPVPLPQGASGSVLFSVSCSSSARCIAVGYHPNGAGGNVPLAERWDGSQWSVQPLPDPGGSAVLQGVSCASDAACVAVGSIDSDSGIHPLVESWDGSGWSLQPTPANVVGLLYGISCPTATSCMAVGEDQQNSPEDTPLAEVWDGQSWTVHSPSDPLLPQPFRSVSCRSTTSACTAVGSFTDQGSSDAASWDGSTWTPESVQQSQSAANTQLQGVDCPSSDECVAVGRTTTFAASVFSGSLGEGWNGTSWSIEATPEAVMRTDSDAAASLFGVSCPERGYCVAVGSSQNAPALIAVRQNLDTPLPTTEAATDITSSAATLQGTINRDEWAVSDCHFEWGTTPAYGHSAPCAFSSPGAAGPVAVHAALAGLTSATTYHFRLDAANVGGFSAGADMSFTTSAGQGPPAPEKPTAPLTLGTTRVGRHSSVFSANVKRVNSYKLKQRARLLDLTVYLQPRGKRGSQGVMGIVYGNRRGRPGRLLAHTERLRVAGTSQPGWYHLRLRQPLALRTGRYWLGLMTGGTGGVLGYRFRTVRHARDLNANRFNRGPSKRFGHFSVDNCLMALYATLG